MTGSAEPDWPAIRRLYAAGRLTLAAIAAQHRITVQRISRRARKDGWSARPRRTSSARDGPDRTSGSKPAAAGARANAIAKAAEVAATSLKARRALVRRLYKAIDTKLKQMERRMAHDMAIKEDSSDTTAADHERDTRAIGSLIANLSRVTEIEADLERLPGSPSPAAGPTDNHADRQLADEADRFRRDVAERLARLVRPA